MAAQQRATLATGELARHCASGSLDQTYPPDGVQYYPSYTVTHRLFPTPTEYNRSFQTSVSYLFDLTTK